MAEHDDAPQITLKHEKIEDDAARLGRAVFCVLAVFHLWESTGSSWLALGFYVAVSVIVAGGWELYKIRQTID